MEVSRSDQPPSPLHMALGDAQQVKTKINHKAPQENNNREEANRSPEMVNKPFIKISYAEAISRDSAPTPLINDK